MNWINRVIEICEIKKINLIEAIQQNIKILKSFDINEVSLVTMMELFPIKVRKVVKGKDEKIFAIGTYKSNELLKVVGSFEDEFDLKFTMEDPHVIEELLRNNKKIPVIDNHPDL